MRTLILLVLTMPVLAQTPSETRVAPPAGHIFERLGITPTGQNGMEELILAGEWANQSQLLQDAQNPGATLSLKRHTLQDPPVVRGLALMRAGLNKPIHTVHSKMGVKTVFPQMALFRMLARLMAIEQYVLLADGKVSQAIDSMVDGARLGEAVQQESMISGLVGISIDTIAATMIARHLDQLSARDCDRLSNVVNLWLKAGDPAGKIIHMERQMTASYLEEVRHDPALLQEMIGVNDPLGPEITTLFNSNPAAANAALDRAGALTQEYYNRSIAMMNKDPWERGEFEIAEMDSLPGRLSGLLGSQISRVLDSYTRIRAQIQMLGLHAAIHRYRWEHEKYPDSLAALRVGRLAQDPFTGQMMGYKMIGDSSYELFSEGPVDRDDKGRPIQGPRRRIEIPYKPKP